MPFIKRNFLFEKEEVLNEGKIYSDHKFTISIDFGEQGTNFIYDPYVKVYPAQSATKADKVARIHFLRNYKYEKPHRDKDVITFDNKDLKIICNLIKQNWTKIIKIFIDGCNITGTYKEQLLKSKYPEELYDSLKK